VTPGVIAAGGDRAGEGEFNCEPSLSIVDSASDPPGHSLEVVGGINPSLESISGSALRSPCQPAFAILPRRAGESLAAKDGL